MNLAVIMTICYLLIVIGISVYFGAKKKNSEEFMVAKRSFGVAIIIPLLFSELIAGAATLGNAATAYKLGLSSAWIGWTMTVAVLTLMLVAGKFYRAISVEKGVMAVPETYAHMFDKRSRIVLLFILVISYIILLSNQPLAAGYMISGMTGWNLNVVIWSVAGICILATILGGMRGIAWMNIVNASTLIIGMGIIAYMSVRHVGGIAQMQAALPPSYFSITQPSVAVTLANIIGTALSYLCGAIAVAVIFSAKSMKDARIGFFICAIILLVFATFPALMGMSAKIVLPDIDPNNALFAMANYFGEVYGGIISMAVIAAIWSTAPALLLVTATILTRDFYMMKNPNATDAQQMWFLKSSIVGIGVVATFIGLNATSILDSIFGALQIRSSAGLVLAIAMFWPRVTKDAAFWSMLIGGITAAVWFFFKNPYGISALWPAMVVTLLVLVPMTLHSKEAVSPGYKMYREALKSAEEKGTL